MRFRVVGPEAHQNADPPHLTVLSRPRRNRPRRCAVEQGDELAPSQMIEMHPISPGASSTHGSLIELAETSQRKQRPTNFGPHSIRVVMGTNCYSNFVPKAAIAARR